MTAISHGNQSHCMGTVLEFLCALLNSITHFTQSGRVEGLRGLWLQRCAQYSHVCLCSSNALCSNSFMPTCIFQTNLLISNHFFKKTLHFRSYRCIWLSKCCFLIFFFIQSTFLKKSLKILFFCVVLLFWVHAWWAALLWGVSSWLLACWGKVFLTVSVALLYARIAGLQTFNWFSYLCHLSYLRVPSHAMGLKSSQL